MTKRTDDSHPDPPNLDELISLREASERSGLSASHLRLLVSRGTIWGVKLGRNWVTIFVRDGRPIYRDPGEGSMSGGSGTWKERTRRAARAGRVFPSPCKIWFS